MKIWAALIGIAGLSAAFLQPASKDDAIVFFLAGDSNGYLAPCGCSSPMMGGVKRRASAIRSLGGKGRTLVLENGGLVLERGRQDEIKVETFAEMHAAVGGTAINLCYSEAKLGIGVVSSLARLSGGHVITSSMEKSAALDLPETIAASTFAVGGASTHADQIALALGEVSVPLDTAVKRLIDEASASRRVPVLMLDGDRAAAVKLAERFPDLALIQYKSAGRPPDKLERIGRTVLATPGDGGKSIVRLVWRNGAFESYVPIELAPSYKDDTDAARIYKTYLRRVSEEKLLEALPRPEKGKYVGSAACLSCHKDAAKVWQHSKHASAFKTLEHEGHERDPDCVECHVVGLASIYGFRSRSLTPGLAAVGCESCHGPGAAHTKSPKLYHLPKIGEKSCQPCHTPENSPRFVFSTYWAKIKHK